MPTNLDTFWTDDVQANERLIESYIMKQNEIVRVTAVAGGEIAYRNMATGRDGRLPMRDTAWNKFRSLPPLGWINVTLDKPKKMVFAVYLRRNSVRCRTHGLSNTNTTAYDFKSGGDGVLVKSRIVAVQHVFEKGSYNEDNPFVNFEEAYALLGKGDSVALSSKFALYKDTRGIVTLYRKRKAIGFVPDNNTLLLFADSRFYREDVQDNKKILPVTIKEL